MIKPKDPDVLEAIDTELDSDVGRGRPSTAGEAKAAGAEAEGDEPAPADTATERGAAADEAPAGDPAPEPAETRQEPAERYQDTAAVHHEEHPAEHGHRSLAATMLTALVGILVVAGLTLWAAPKLAPHVPAGIGRYLQPGQADFEARLGAIDQALAGRKTETDAALAALTTQLADLAKRVEAAEQASTAATAQAGGEALAVAESASAAASALAERLSALDTEIAQLRDEQASVARALSDAASSGAAASPEVSAAIAALTSRIDKIGGLVEGRADAKAVESRFAELTRRIDEAEANVAAARSAQSETMGEVSSAIHQASLRAAVAALSSRVTAGSPYAAPLGDVAALSGKPAPEALAAGAESGLATAADLAAGFPPFAQAAVAADVQSRAGDDLSARLLGWLRAQVTGRPTSEQEGDSVGAVTSRIGARIDEGNLPQALAEAETLPPHSQAALGGWLDRLRAAVAAKQALDAWLAEIGAAG